MGDFVLDFRPRNQRQLSKAAAALTFVDGTKVSTFDEPAFGLVLTSVDDAALWGPFQSADRKIFIALNGRIALAQKEWDAAGRRLEPGGLACKHIYELYRSGGLSALHDLNGTFTALIYDAEAGVLHMVTDRCGMAVVYGPQIFSIPSVFSSHPDAVATLLGEEQNLDLVSLSQFLMAGHLTFPFTYYANVRALDLGTIYTFATKEQGASLQSKSKYFDFNFKIDGSSADDLAGSLAQAFQNSIKKRTLPLLGQSFVGLSGGLDSRAILSAAPERGHVRSFTLFDEKNLEVRTAERLANSMGVELVPFQRDFEYYANFAETGVRISGGVGSIASNHFLGVREKLMTLGARNLLTGCYCDYLLKALALNTREQRFSRHEEIAPFNFGFYRPFYSLKGSQQNNVRQRFEEQFPEHNKTKLTEQDWLQIESKRCFPLAYEGDLAQRVIPLRTMPWYLPIVDNEIINTYLKIPSRLKLNGAIFKRMARIVCGDVASKIPDSNSGAALDAAGWNYSVHRYLSALQNRIAHKLRPRMATRGSWPNWDYYIQHSPKIAQLWSRKHDAASQVFVSLLGSDPIARPAASFRGREVELFMRYFTLKLWLEQRARN
jgi:asparagine synthase (glutamine-hydrolysing)